MTTEIKDGIKVLPILMSLYRGNEGFSYLNEAKPHSSVYSSANNKVCRGCCANNCYTTGNPALTRTMLSSFLVPRLSLLRAGRRETLGMRLVLVDII